MVKHGTGNWQTRHQALQAKRKAAKLRKQQSNTCKEHRRAVQACLASLSSKSTTVIKQQESSDATLSLYLWVTKKSDPRADKQQEQDPEQDEESSSTSFWQQQQQQQRPRSVSLNEAPSPGFSGKSRRRSLSFGEKANSARHCHPRSKEHGMATDRAAAASNNGSDTLVGSYMCQEHFFRGRCRCKKKHGHSSLLHLPVDTAECMCRFLGTEPKQQVGIVQQAVPVDIAWPGAMPALYLIRYDHVSTSKNSNLASQVAEWLLTRHQVSLSDIVYMVCQRDLVFDAHRQDGSVLGDTSNKRGSIPAVMVNNCNSSCDYKPQKAAEIVQGLPTILLEHILSYLPDEATGIVSQVCHTWRRELTASSHLWQCLLQRHMWPGDDRSAFVSHYSVMSEMKKLATGLEALRSHGPLAATAKSRSLSVYQGQMTNTSNKCSGQSALHLQPWSAAKILVGHGDDCTIRLLETITKADGSGEKHGRELVRHNVDIYRNTRRRRSTLVSMALDDVSIGCLLRVVDGSDSTSTSEMTHGGQVEDWLVVMLREDFLIQGESESDSAMEVINVRDMVLDFLIAFNAEEISGRTPWEFRQGMGLHDFLSFGGDMNQVKVICSDHVVACGSQYYVLEASISYAGIEEDTMDVMDRRLFVISTAVEAIVWMGDAACHVPGNLPLLPEGSLTLSHARNATGCSFVVSGGPWLCMGPKIRTTAERTSFIEVTPQAKQLEKGTLGLLPMEGKVHTAMTSSYLVRACRAPERDSNEDDLEISIGQIRVNIQTLENETDDESQSSLLLSYVHDIHKMGFLNYDQYAFLVCWCSVEMPHLYLEAIILHLASGREIGRVSLPRGAHGGELPEIVQDFDTLAAGYRGSANGGLVMTGFAICEAPLDKSMRTMKKREKSKRRRHGKKKDGYQRGSSLFG